MFSVGLTQAIKRHSASIAAGLTALPYKNQLRMNGGAKCFCAAIEYKVLDCIKHGVVEAGEYADSQKKSLWGKVGNN